MYTYTLCSSATTTLSLRSRTARTSFLKESSPMQRLWWSSHIMTLFGGYAAERPPPTSARMLHRKSISTMPIPPFEKSRRYVCLKGSQLKMRKPESVPHAKHPWSWLNPQ